VSEHILGNTSVDNYGHVRCHSQKQNADRTRRTSNCDNTEEQPTLNACQQVSRIRRSTKLDGYTRSLQQTLQMYSLPAAPGIRLADCDTPEATTQSDRSHKNARLTGTRDDGPYHSLLTLRPSAAPGLMYNIPK
jgi:hypothetical protein